MLLLFRIVSRRFKFAIPWDFKNLPITANSFPDFGTAIANARSPIKWD